MTKAFLNQVIPLYYELALKGFNGETYSEQELSLLYMEATNIVSHGQDFSRKLMKEAKSAQQNNQKEITQ